MEWQPIETAPKGPTLILWNGELLCTGWCDNEGQWYCDQWAEHHAEIDDDPTHWMPLPAPPTDA